jgi:hypothetical protein
MIGLLTSESWTTVDVGAVVTVDVEVATVVVLIVVGVVVVVVGLGVVIGILTGVVDDVITSDPVTRIGFRFDPATFAATADEAEIEKIFFVSWKNIKNDFKFIFYDMVILITPMWWVWIELEM